MRKKLLALFAFLALACGISAAAAGPAAAATAPSVRPALVHANCGGGSCYGVDPQSSGCANSATTVLAHDYLAENQASFALEIRYSSACAAAWLRLTVWSGSNIGFSGTAWNPGG